MVLSSTITVYNLMSKRELSIECKRLESMQHEYAKRGLVVMASSYAGKLVSACLILADKE